MQINRETYEEYFLLYTDGELDAAGRAEVEAFVLLHPDLKVQLDLLRQSVVEPDEHIVFENKHLLFRKEKDQPRIFMMHWRKIAAAAIIFTMLGAAWYFIERDDPRIDPELAGSVHDDHTNPGGTINQQDIAERKTGPSAQDTLVSAITKGQETAGTRHEKAKAGAEDATGKTREIQAGNNKNEVNRTSEKEKSNLVAKAKKTLSKKKSTGAESVVPPDMAPPEIHLADRDISMDIVRAVPSGVDKKSKISIPVKARDIAAPEQAWPEKDDNIHYASGTKSFSPDDGDQYEEDNNIYFANTAIPKKSNLKVLFRKASRIIDRITTLQ